jgi:hypothetical protein
MFVTYPEERAAFSKWLSSLFAFGDDIGLSNPHDSIFEEISGMIANTYKIRCLYRYCSCEKYRDSAKPVLASHSSIGL